MSRAREIWDSLDTYGKSQIIQWGTAFTTYEDEGPDVERDLNEIAARWRDRARALDVAGLPCDGPAVRAALGEPPHPNDAT